MVEEVESDDDDSVPYNPKNLPLGWDGKVSGYLLVPHLASHSHSLSLLFSPSHIGCISYMVST